MGGTTFLISQELGSPAGSETALVKRRARNPTQKKGGRVEKNRSKYLLLPYPGRGPRPRLEPKWPDTPSAYDL